MTKQAVTGGGLEVGEDRRWQEKYWVVQRFGWAAMAVFLLAAFFGATGGGGPLASARVESASGAIEYPRIARWQSADQVTVHVPAASTGEVEIELEKAFVDLFAIESVEPEPSAVAATPGGHRFTFDFANGDGSRTIAFHVRASKPVLRRPIGARIGDGPPTRMAITVLP
jgi:hypothetical protein